MKIIYDDLVEFSKVVVRCTNTAEKGMCKYCPFYDRCQIDDLQNRHVQFGELAKNKTVGF